MGEIFQNLAMGFGVVGNFQSVLWILIGVCVGILGGAILVLIGVEIFLKNL